MHDVEAALVGQGADRGSAPGAGRRRPGSAPTRTAPRRHWRGSASGSAGTLGGAHAAPTLRLARPDLRAAGPPPGGRGSPGGPAPAPTRTAERECATARKGLRTGRAFLGLWPPALATGAADNCGSPRRPVTSVAVAARMLLPPAPGGSDNLVEGRGSAAPSRAPGESGSELATSVAGWPGRRFAPHRGHLDNR